MAPVDLFLIPIYVTLFYFFFKRKRKKFNDPLLKKYHLRGFWIKIIASILFILYYSYLTVGDTTVLYQYEGNNLYHLILKDWHNIQYIFSGGEDFDLSLVKNPYNRGYFKSDGNFIIIKLDAILSFISFGSFAVINLFFACFAFSGLWKLYLFFYGQKPQMHKQFAIAILYFPTVAFWSAGLLKDTICIAAIGWLTYSLYDLFIKRKSIIKNGLIIFISAYFLTIIKVYILLAYVPFFGLFMILKSAQYIQLKLFRFIFIPLILGISVFIFSETLTTHSDDLGQYAVEGLTSSITNLNEAILSKSSDDGSTSNFSLGKEFDGSFSGFIKIAPYAVTATFFRPFIWEAHKISQFMAAIESLLLMIFTLIVLFKSKTRILAIILSDSLIMYCFLFAVVFGLFVGVSTLNFGTLVRYKIPCLPFYLISLFLINERCKIYASQRESNKIKNYNRLIPV